MFLLLTGFTVALIAASQKQSENQIVGTLVTLDKANREDPFLKVEDVERLILKQGVDVKNQNVGSINVDEIETIVQSNPWVKNAEVFVDNLNRLNVAVLQRIPVARVIEPKGNSFYIDEDGVEMPLSDRYAYPVPVFTNYKRYSDDSLKNKLDKRIVFWSQVISADSFWNAQITQIDVLGWRDFNFYTTLGNQKIKVGDTLNAQKKLDNLFTFYHEVSNKVGWDRYQTLDIRFEGQVVAYPSLGWTPPKDTSARSLNTVASPMKKQEADPPVEAQAAKPSVSSNSNLKQNNKPASKPAVKPEGRAKGVDAKAAKQQKPKEK